MSLTCKQAAAQIREWADQTPYPDRKERLKGQAEILGYFGDQPLPASLRNEYKFTEPPKALCDVRDKPYGDPCWKCGEWHLEEEAARKAGTLK